MVIYTVMEKRAAGARTAAEQQSDVPSHFVLLVMLVTSSLLWKHNLWHICGFMVAKRFGGIYWAYRELEVNQEHLANRLFSVGPSVLYTHNCFLSSSMLHGFHIRPQRNEQTWIWFHAWFGNPEFRANWFKTVTFDYLCSCATSYIYCSGSSCIPKQPDARSAVSLWTGLG